MQFLSLCIFVFLLCLIYAPLQAAETMKSVTYADNKLDNGIILVTFDLQEGVFSIHDAKTNEALLSDARFSLPSREPPNSVKPLKVEDVNDALGVGKNGFRPLGVRHELLQRRLSLCIKLGGILRGELGDGLAGQGQAERQGSAHQGDARFATKHSLSLLVVMVDEAAAQTPPFGHALHSE